MTSNPSLYSHYEHLLFEYVDDGVLVITMNRPEVYNATNDRMHAEIGEVWRDVDRDPATNVVVLRGAGKAFSAGGDMALIDEMIDDYAARSRVLKEARDLVYNMINCEKIIVSAIHGPAVGAGLVAALLADISIASKSARIVDGHTKLGVAAGDHAAIVWPLLCSMAKAKYHLLLCEEVNGEEAERIGLVSRCVADGEEFTTALEVAQRLAAGPQQALRLTKLTLNNWLRQAGPIFDASLGMEFFGFAGPDVTEGVAAIREKRAPKFN